MKLLNAIAAGSLIFCSAFSYAGDGHDRSTKMNEKFRAEQKRIHDTESANKNTNELKINNSSQEKGKAGDKERKAD